MHVEGQGPAVHVVLHGEALQIHGDEKAALGEQVGRQGHDGLVVPGLEDRRGGRVVQALGAQQRLAALVGEQHDHVGPRGTRQHAETHAHPHRLGGGKGPARGAVGTQHGKFQTLHGDLPVHPAMQPPGQFLAESAAASLGVVLQVDAHALVHGAVEGHAPRAQHHHPVAQLAHSGHVVAHEQDGPPATGHPAHAVQALALEVRVAHGQHLVHEQDFRFQVRGHGKGQAHVHARGVALDRRVHETLQLGESHDGLEALGHLAAGHAQDGAVQEDVLAAGEVGVEARADLEHAGHAPAQQGPALGGRGDARQNLEQGGLARAVLADDAHDLPGGHLEAHVAQGPEMVLGGVRAVGQDGFGPRAPGQPGPAPPQAAPQARRADAAQFVALGNPAHVDGRCAEVHARPYTVSMKFFSTRENTARPSSKTPRQAAPATARAGPGASPWPRNP
jgi:hypothetical protein